MTRWEHRLTPEEEATCARVGFERQLPYLGQPKANRNYSEGDVWEIWQHSVAAGSELAFARMMGMQDFIPHVNKWNTEQDVPGFEIRYCFTKKEQINFEHSLRMHTRDKDDHVYVLLTGGLEERTRRLQGDEWLSPAYTAVGWSYGRDARVDAYADMWGGWRVPATRLRKMSELEDAGW
jgi:hypothetical protein